MRNVEQRRARWMRVRLFALVAMMGVGFARLAARAHELGVRQGPHLRDQAEQQYLREIQVQPRRGTIYDRHRNPLAVTVDVPSLVANPRALRRHAVDVRGLGARLAAALGMPPAEVAQQLQMDTAYRWIRHFLRPEEVTGVRAAMAAFHVREGEGLDLPLEPRRWYPNRELAAQVLGFVGTDGHGLEGIERALDEQLRGRTLNLRGVRDAMGRLVFADGLTPADGQGGNDVTLTIDKTIQFIAETELAHTINEFEARGGSIIVTEPRTGEVLAMASFPTFNPNDYARSDPDARRNRAIADRFEPGSTMKVFTVGGALDLGVIRPDQLINCYGGVFTIGDLTIHDDHADSWLTPMQVLARSSNIGAAQIGATLGSDGLERVFRRFGFGERTGLPLLGEARARFGERRWYDVEVATVSFGQGMSVTAIQLAQALGVVANGGRLVNPLLVTRVQDATGQLVEEHTPDAGRPAMDPRTARLVADMLSAVTEEGGTGVAAAIPGVRVAGKTGTAQKANEHGRGYDADRWVASFIGFAPADHPAILVTVIIDEPTIDHYGGNVSAPCFRRVAEQTLRYLGRLPPTASADVPAPPRVRRGDAATRPGAAEGGSRARITVNARRTGTSGGIPDVQGMTARAVVRTLAHVGIDAVIEGSGTVVSQSPAAGMPVPQDHRVFVQMRPGGGAPAPQRDPAADADGESG